MNATAANAMACEWARIDRLANCLTRSQRRRPVDEKAIEELTRIRQQVDAARDDTLWRGMVSHYGRERIKRSLGNLMNHLPEDA